MVGVAETQKANTGTQERMAMLDSTQGTTFPSTGKDTGDSRNKDECAPGIRVGNVLVILKRWKAQPNGSTQYGEGKRYT